MALDDVDELLRGQLVGREPDALDARPSEELECGPLGEVLEPAGDRPRQGLQARRQRV